MNHKPERVHIAGVPFDRVTYEETLVLLRHFLAGHEKRVIVTPNPEMVVYAQEDAAFRRVIEQADLTLPDGTGILWASSFLKKASRRGGGWARAFHLMQSLAGAVFSPHSIRTVFKERVTGTDLLEKIVAASEKEGWKLFLLGAAPGVAEIAIEHLFKKYPQAKFTGAYAGTPADKDEAALIARVNAAAPDILFVAYGSPSQEFWIARNLARLTSVKVAIGVGGAFDFFAGVRRRAPKWMRTAGLEWLFRFVQEPKRAARIYRATIAFPKIIFRQKG